MEIDLSSLSWKELDQLENAIKEGRKNFLKISDCYVVEGQDGELHLCTIVYKDYYFVNCYRYDNFCFCDVFTREEVDKYSAKEGESIPEKYKKLPVCLVEAEITDSVRNHIRFNNFWYSIYDKISLETLASMWEELFKLKILEFRLKEEQTKINELQAELDKKWEALRAKQETLRLTLEKKS